MKQGIAALAATTLLLASPALAADGDMSVAAFLAKASSLQKKGPLALLSGDLSQVKAEIKASTLAYRAKVQADKAAGRKPETCPPQHGSITANDLLTHFRSYPVPEQKRLSVRQAFYDIMRKRYPCP